MSDPVTPNESLEAVANLVPDALTAVSPATPMQPSSMRTLRVEDWLTDRGIPFQRKEKVTTDGRLVWEIPCPFNPDHSRGEACVMQDASGRMSAKCHHDSCSKQGWSAFRDEIGKPDSHHWIEPNDGQAAERDFGLTLMTSGEFEAADFRQNYLVSNVLVEGQPCIIGGPKKCLKTGVIVDLAISLGTGTPFLSHPDFSVPQRKRVCVLSGESGGYTLRATAKRVCKARGKTLREADVLWGMDLPQLANAQHLIVLTETLMREQIDVLVIDPAYLCLLSGSNHINPGNVFAMGEVLNGIARVGNETGCTIIIAHHTRKQSQNDRFRPTDLEDLAMSGFAEFARQWLLLGRRSEYQSDGRHALWMNIGGSAGHSSCHALNVEERVDNGLWEDRVWHVELERPEEAIERERSARRASRKEGYRLDHLEALKQAVGRFPEGETKSCLRSASTPQIPATEFDALMQELIKQGEVEECKVVKNKRKERGYRPACQSVF